MSLRQAFALPILLFVAGPAVPDDPLPPGATARLGSARMAIDSVDRVVFLPPDYRALAVPSSEGVWRYDATTGRRLDAKAAAEGVELAPITVSADGRRAASLRSRRVRIWEGLSILERRIIVWEVVTGRTVWITPANAPAEDLFSSARSLSADGHLIAWSSKGKDNKTVVNIWDVDRGTEKARLTFTEVGMLAFALSPDGQALATWWTRVEWPSAHEAQIIRVWDVATGKERFHARATRSPTTAAFSPDGAVLAVSDGAGVIDLFDAKTGSRTELLLGRTGQGLRLAFSPDGRSVAALGSDGWVQTWAVRGGRLLTTTEPPEAVALLTARGLGFTRQGQVVAWGTAGPTAVAWEVPSRRVVTPVGRHTGSIISIGFAADGREVLTAGTDGRLARWDASGKPRGLLKLRAARDASADRQEVIVARDGGKLMLARGLADGGYNAGIHDPETGNEVFAVPGDVPDAYIPSANLTRVAVVQTPDPKAPLKKGEVVVWNLSRPEKVAEFEVPLAAHSSVLGAFSPDGTRLVTRCEVSDPASGTDKKDVIISWDLTAGKKLCELDVPDDLGVITYIAVRDNTTAFVASWSGEAHLRALDYAAGKMSRELPIGPRAVGALAVSPDGKRLAVGESGCSDGRYAVRVFGWPTGKLLHTFTGHTASVSALAFAPDGKTLASGGDDTVVLLWNVSAAK